MPHSEQAETAVDQHVNICYTYRELLLSLANLKLLDECREGRCDSTVTIEHKTIGSALYFMWVRLVISILTQ